jgi:hypothetical protein
MGLGRRRDGLAAAALGAVVCLILLPIAPGGVPILASVVGAVVVVLAGRMVATTGPEEDHEPGAHEEAGA